MAAAAPQHRVQRLLVELVGVRHADAAALQAAAQRQVQQQLLPLIDRLCTQLGDADVVQRIDRLVVDLPAAPATAWAGGGTGGQALPAPWAAALAHALGQALHTATTVQTDVELVAGCLHTGQLPWWADAADRSLLQGALGRLLSQPVLHGQPWLPPADADAPALQRLVAALTDAQAAALAGHLQPRDGDGAVPWPALLAAVAQALGLPVARLRQAWWCEALAVALQPPGQSAHAARALALRQLPARLGLPPGVVAAAWRRALDQTSAQAGSAAAAAPLWQALDTAWPDARPQPAAGPAPAAAAAAAAFDVALTGLATLMAQRLPGDPAHAWLPWLQVLRQHASGPAARHLAALLAQGAPAAKLAAALQDTLSALPVPAGAGPHQRPAAAAALAALLQAPTLTHSQPAAPQASPAPTAAAADALYLANAGLVLLWPFVQRFADRLGLLHDRQLRSPAHAARLAVLLQCAATGDADPPEYQLPLNKLLSGLPLDAPTVLDAPLTADEQDECAGLLSAVLQAAPLLGSISHDGLRQAFLQRSGQLSTQDGHWLLRVERATHDVLVDRLPWSPAIVRLPWMPRLLQVQW